MKITKHINSLSNCLDVFTQPFQSFRTYFTCFIAYSVALFLLFFLLLYTEISWCECNGKTSMMMVGKIELNKKQKNITLFGWTSEKILTLNSKILLLFRRKNVLHKMTWTVDFQSNGKHSSFFFHSAAQCMFNHRWSKKKTQIKKCEEKNFFN